MHLRSTFTDFQKGGNRTNAKVEAVCSVNLKNRYAA